MTSASSDKSLHFVVRDPGYRQSPGYAMFMNQVLQQLNTNPPQNARGLVMESAGLLAGNKQIPNEPSEEIPTKLTRGKREVLEKMREKLGEKDKLVKVFSSVANARFGAICMRSDTDLITPANARGYIQAVEKNIGSDVTDRQFHYQLSDSRELLLMRVVPCADIKDEYERNIRAEYKDEWYIQRQLNYFLNSKAALAHPAITQENFSLLLDAIDEQLDIMNLGQKVEPSSKLPQEKKEALATTYWLMAQSTPTWRGGSAHANLILQHLGERLKQQGYDYEVPYTKDGTDLWVEAATTDVGTFKQRFVKGEYFDPSLSDELVRQRLDEIKANQNQQGPDTVVTDGSISSIPKGRRKA